MKQKIEVYKTRVDRYKTTVTDSRFIDLGRYAGTYGGYIKDAPKPRQSWWRKLLGRLPGAGQWKP